MNASDYEGPIATPMNIPAPLAQLYSVHGDVLPYDLPQNVRAQWQSRWHYRLVITTRRGREYATAVHVDHDIQTLAHELRNGWVTFYPYDGTLEILGEGRERKFRVLLPNIEPLKARE